MLSWISSEDWRDFLQLEPLEVVPFMSLVQPAFNEIKAQGRDKAKIPETIEAIREMISSLTKELGINSIFEGMINFINDNAEEDMLDEED